MNFEHSRQPAKYQSGVQRERGQIILEYVLLLIFAVGIALMITRQMVGRDPDNPGFVIKGWTKVIQAIGADQADDTKK